jgi:TRAP-type C4-dicarboxylate transport system substrate-binding protein
MNYVQTIAVAAAAIAVVTATDAEAVTLKLATDSGAQGSDAGNAIEAWAKAIEEGTNGDIQVDLFYQNQLGGQQEVFDLLMAGDVDIMLNWPMASYDQRVSMLYTPYMFSTWDDALKAYEPGGWLNKTIDSVYADMGLKFFGAWPEGFNGVATAKSHATRPEDAGDLKVRVPPIFPFPETLQAMGYQTASIDWGEIFTSVQTGVVDGDAANVVYYDYEYFRDVLDYYVASRQNFITGMLSMNLDDWDALEPAHQKVIENAAHDVMRAQFAAAKERNAFYAAQWKDAGNTFVELSDEDIAAYAKIARETVWPQMESRIGGEIMDIIRANASKF